MSKTKYLYVRDNNNFPVGTFAYKVKTKGEKVKLSFAFSVFYMSDEYSRKFARAMTKERLEKPIVLKGSDPGRLLVQALRMVSKNPVNHWRTGKPQLGHRFATACRQTARRLGSTLARAA